MEAIEGVWFLNAPFDVVEASLIKALRFDICLYYKHDRVAEAYSHYYGFGYGTTSWHKQFVTAIWVRKIKAGTEIEIQGPPKPSMVLPLDEQGNPILLPETQQDSEGLENHEGAESLTPEFRAYLIRLSRLNRSKIPDPKDVERYEAAVGFQQWLLTRVFEVFNLDLAAQDAHARLQLQKTEEIAAPAGEPTAASEELFIDDIDSFAQARNVEPQAVQGLLPLDLSEDQIQTYLEEIIGENFHQQDWGGEINDLMTSQLIVDGTRLRAAFLLKGNGTKGKLTISKCGKNGDQIVRLADAPVDLYVVQHVSEIDERVVYDLKSKIQLKNSRGHKCRMCIIDGTDTARILRAYGKI